MFHLVCGAVFPISQMERKQKLKMAIRIQIPNVECWLRVRDIFRCAAAIPFFMSSQFDCYSRSIIRNSTESRAKEPLIEYHKNDTELHLSQSRNIYTNLFHSFFYIAFPCHRDDNLSFVPNAEHRTQNIQHKQIYTNFIVSVVCNQRCHIFNGIW